MIYTTSSVSKKCGLLLLDNMFDHQSFFATIIYFVMNYYYIMDILIMNYFLEIQYKYRY
jgi:hypothetical protein